MCSGNLKKENCYETNPLVLLISRLLGLKPGSLVTGLQY